MARKVDKVFPLVDCSVDDEAVQLGDVHQCALDDLEGGRAIGGYEVSALGCDLAQIGCEAFHGFDGAECDPVLQFADPLLNPLISSQTCCVTVMLFISCLNVSIILAHALGETLSEQLVLWVFEGWHQANHAAPQRTPKRKAMTLSIRRSP